MRIEDKPKFEKGRQKVDYAKARKTICIDFNGVLDTYKGWTGKMYPPREGAKEFLKTLQELGYSVVVFTAAPAQSVAEWLDEHEMSEYVDRITNMKVPAIIYLDDRGITFSGDFYKALDDIINFKTHWEDPEHHEGGNLKNG